MLREWFLPRSRLEVEWRPVLGRATLFPDTIDELRVDAEFEFLGRRIVLLLIMVHTEDGTLVQEGLIGWVETDARTREKRALQQRVPVAKLVSGRRHGGQTHEHTA